MMIGGLSFACSLSPSYIYIDDDDDDDDDNDDLTTMMMMMTKVRLEVPAFARS